MSIWKNKSKEFQDSTSYSIFKWYKKQRSEIRKEKIKRLNDKSER